MADEKTSYNFNGDYSDGYEKSGNLAEAARRQSVALNIVENPLKVSLPILASSSWSLQASKLTRLSATAQKQGTRR